MTRSRKSTKKSDMDTDTTTKKTQDGGNASVTSNTGVVDSDSHTCNQCKQVFTGKNDQMLICERCDNFVCVPCADISSSEYSVLQKSAHLHWFCDSCESAALAAVKEDRLIEEKCSALFKEFRQEMEKELINRLTSLKEELLKNNVSVTDKSDGGKVDVVSNGRVEQGKGGDDSAKLLAEMTERDKRKANLVWFGVPESNSDDTQTRKIEDTRFVKKACSQALGVEVEIVNCKRLHSHSKKVKEGKDKRPMLVTLRDSNQVDKVLKEARKLKDNEVFRGVFIKKDFTPLERAEMKKLVVERDQKREETKLKMGTENWVIRNGRVVNVTRRSMLEVKRMTEEKVLERLVAEKGMEKGRD